MQTDGDMPANPSSLHLRQQRLCCRLCSCALNQWSFRGLDHPITTAAHFRPKPDAPDEGSDFAQPEP